LCARAVRSGGFKVPLEVGSTCGDTP
jgi:hypothetical protein